MQLAVSRIGRGTVDKARTLGVEDPSTNWRQRVGKREQRRKRSEKDQRERDGQKAEGKGKYAERRREREREVTEAEKR